MKQFSEKILKRMSYLGFPFSFKAAKIGVVKYNSEIRTGKLNFSKSILSFYPNNKIEAKKMLELYTKAIIFRSNKKLIKELLDLVLTNSLLFLVIIFPFLTTFFLFNNSISFINYFIIYLLSYTAGLLIANVLMPIIKFTGNIEIKIGKAVSGFIKFAILSSFCYSIVYFKEINDEVVKAIIYSTYALSYLFILFSIFTYIIEMIVDTLYYSNKIILTDELIIESAFRLSKVNWNDAIKKRSIRQNTIEEIERIARLIENDWSSHIMPGDEKTIKWKNETLQGIAAVLRSYKRDLIIPSTSTPKELENKFKVIFEKFLKHDIKGLINSDVPAFRVRKKSKFILIQSVFVAILPLIISLILWFYVPDLQSNNILQVGIIISVFWIIICILLWLDPNLGDKVATIKSVRELWKGEKSE